MKIQKSAEDYLESILMIKEKQGYTRSVDISLELGVTKPSVSYATKRLRENGYITINDDGHIELTESGYEIADRMYVRHKTLTAFLTKIGVREEQAAEDACKIEHDLSAETFDAICKFVGEELGIEVPKHPTEQ
jgi:Mn-dependent DtxR family transcriptional regulator